jgi:hypothetical protein
MVPDRVDFPQRFPTSACAVYALCCAGEVVYVGQSISIYARIATHANNYRRWRTGKRLYSGFEFAVQFDEVWVKYCAERELDQLEFQMIQKYQPKYNIALRRLDPIEVEIRSRRMRIDLDKLGLSKWTQGSKRSSQGFARRV